MKKHGGKPFVKGPDPRRAPGRPPGTPNKVTRAIKEFLAEMADDRDVQEAFKDQIVSGNRGSMAAYLGVVSHVLGSPKASLELGITPSMGNLLALALKGRNTDKPEPKKKAS